MLSDKGENQASTEQQNAVRQILYLTTETFLRALSPFMPFLAEELFQRLPAKGSDWPESVCIAAYPQPCEVSLQSLCICVYVGVWECVCVCVHVCVCVCVCVCMRVRVYMCL